MNTSKIRKILVGLLVLGALSAALSTGTFATFNATTTNDATIQTGTLILGNNVNAQANDCLSAQGGGGLTTNSNACAALWNVTNRGGASGNLGNQDIRLENLGTVNASTFSMYTNGCTNGSNATTINGTAYTGTGNLCTNLQFFIAQTASDYTTVTNCIYGNAAGTGAAGGLNGCDFTAADTLNGFTSTHNGSGSALSLGSLNAGGGNAKYFVLGLYTPDMNNSFQGRSATTTFTWTIAE